MRLPLNGLNLDSRHVHARRAKLLHRGGHVVRHALTVAGEAGEELVNVGGDSSVGRRLPALHGRLVEVVESGVWRVTTRQKEANEERRK